MRKPREPKRKEWEVNVLHSLDLDGVQLKELEQHILDQKIEGVTKENVSELIFRWEYDWEDRVLTLTKLVYESDENFQRRMDNYQMRLRKWEQGYG